jgi:hypothetical protein
LQHLFPSLNITVAFAATLVSTNAAVTAATAPPEYHRGKRLIPIVRSFQVVHEYQTAKMPRLDKAEGSMADREVDGQLPPDSTNVSFSLSTPTSPTTHRRTAWLGMSRRNSVEGPDERSPLLLPTSRSRARIQSAYDTTRVPNLSRNDSYTGQYRDGGGGFHVVTTS